LEVGVMSDLESKLRALLADVIRDEVRRAVAEATKVDEYLSTQEAAAFARVAPGTIRRWIRTRRLQRCSAGRTLRVSRAELERVIRTGASNDDATPEQLAAKMFG